ncbi:MAG TPA: hypothetical protein VE441_05240 [Mycobacterium sp.]|jgi:uncharacterized protein YjbJ (UPF0337 family)|nr:hypothetical protein [Mycobacterium sp.]
MALPILRIDAENVAGLLDKIVGLGKEIAGTLAGSDRLTKAGQVQQDKGNERLKAVRAEAEARSYQADAVEAERAQAGAQNTKEAVHGVGEKMKGAAKRKVADVSDNEELRAEGEAQQTKGEAETEQTQARAEAHAHEKEAKALEQQQESLEN